jgi:hypothetical protein
MKTLFTFLLILIAAIGLAQDKVYVHTVTPANIDGHITIIDHPDLNGNPNAPIVYVNNFNPNGSSGVYNDNVSGLWYNAPNWTIYNEDLSAMIEGASFNIYIADDPNDVFTHIATAANSSGHVTTMDNSLVNGLEPGPFLAMSHYYNPNSIYNTGNYGQYYFDNFRRLYDEGFTSVPEGAAFKVLVNGGTGSSRVEHISSAANIVNNWTVIDATELNGNPNATFVMSHYWGVGGASTEVYLDQVLGVWYNGTNWAIYIEDTGVDFPENVAFDIIVAPQDILNTSEFSNGASINMFPNPANNNLTISATQPIEKINIFNILGQEVLSLIGNNIFENINISNLQTGTYFVKVEIDNITQTLKLIKQ